MADVLKYRNDGSVEWFTRSIHEIPYLNQPNYLIGKLEVPNIPMKYWKVDNGILREMTLSEKNIVDSAEAILIKQQLVASALNLEVSISDVLKILLPKLGMTKEDFILLYKQLKGL